MHDWVSKWAVYSPQKVALKEAETGRMLTYGEWNRFGNHLAEYLTRDRGLQKGDRIAVLAESCLEYLILFSAAQKSGFILVPLNYRLCASELDFMLRDAAPRLVIAEDRFLPLLEAAPHYGDIPEKWTIPALWEFCRAADVRKESAPFPPVQIEENDPLFILYTSGTTGFPKGAIYTHKMLFWNSINTAMSLLVNTESRTINCMPPFHTGGWNVLITPFLHHGGYTCLAKKFDAPAILHLLETERPTIFMGVPTMLKMIAEAPGFAAADVSGLHYLIVGGEPMPIPLIEKWHAKGVAVRQGYGMTEVGPNLTSLHQDDAIRKKGSIGRPNFYVSIRIAGEDGGAAATGETGELLLQGPMVTPGYWRNPEATATSIRGGWFHSGDLVRQDEEGFLYVVDRIKNMYISGGENVYPAEVERVISAHEGVSEVAVIGVPDEKWGEAGKAFVVLKPGMVLTEGDILDHCRGLMARYKVPKTAVVVQALPKTDSGKVDRKALGRVGVVHGHTTGYFYKRGKKSPRG